MTDKKQGRDAPIPPLELKPRTHNGLPVIDAKDVTVLTEEQRIERYQIEEKALREKYGVVVMAYVKKYNNGQQIADIELIANPQ